MFSISGVYDGATLVAVHLIEYKRKQEIMNNIKELYQYREMIASLIRRDLRGKYRKSALGFLWTIINPILQLIIYTIVFSIFFPTKIEKYYVFLFVGLVPWIFFQTCLQGGAVSVVSQENLVKKIYFPRLVLPISFVSSAFVNMVITFVVIFVVLIVSGIGVSFSVIWMLPIIMFVEYVLALGTTMLTSALTVSFRDLEHILGIVSMVWMYLTPIMYRISDIPESFQKVLYINPMTGIILAYKDVLYFKRLPNIASFASTVGFTIIVLLLGYFVFDRLQKKFVEQF